MSENFKFFQHRECEFFPCHKTNNEENFNCLFCYCPLYALGEKCGGNFKYIEGGPGAKERREALGAVLGIGYGNSSSFLKKLNRFGITRQQFENGLKDIDKGKTV